MPGLSRAMMSAALVMLAKSPRPGYVKTRLCPPLDPVDAARLHEAFLRDTMSRMRELSEIELVCGYSPDEDRGFFEDALEGVTLVPQASGDLGQRLHEMFVVLNRRGFDRVVATGADTPTLPLAHVQEAFTRLADPEIDVVLGPAPDGGYYLIGLRAPRAELFADIPWSTDRVWTETMGRAKGLALRVHALPGHADVDVFADLLRLAGVIRENADGAQRTRDILDELGLL